MRQFGPPNSCTNLNHRRTDPPVGHCPDCGCTVNQRLPVQHCSDVHHAAARRERAAFCVDCGTQLIFAR